MDNFQKFLTHLDASQEAIWKIASWLHSHGHNVKINAMGRAPSAEEARKYVDNGDLEISLRVEVKKLSAQFTCKDDWPFRKFIVCAKHSWDNAVPKPYAYIYLNDARTHVATVMGHTSSTWTTGWQTDTRYKNYSQEFYYAPLDVVKWSVLTKAANVDELLAPTKSSQS